MLLFLEQYHGPQQVRCNRVWVRKTDTFPALRNELLRLAGNKPDESSTYQGMVDLHWRFTHLVDAQRMAAALSPHLPTRGRAPAPLELR